MATAMGALDRALARVEDALLVCAIALGTVLTCTQVVLRFVFASGIDWSEEVTIYAMVWASFVGAAAGLRQGSHLIVDALLILAPPALARWLARAGLMITLLFGCAFAWYSAWLVIRTQALGQLTPALQMPMWIAYLAMPLAGVLLAIRAILLLAGVDGARQPPKS